MTVAFVGGTGPAGVGLAARFARAGISVAVGSRAPERAEHAHLEILEKAPNADIAWGENHAVASRAEVIFLTVPYLVVRDTTVALADALSGRIVVSMANPIRVKDGRVIFEPPPEGSVAEMVHAAAPGARVVSAFHEVRVSRFANVDRAIDADTLVCGDDPEAKKRVIELASAVEGMRAIDAGGLTNSRYVEGFVAVLVSMNLIHTAGTSYRITGLGRE